MNSSFKIYLSILIIISLLAACEEHPPLYGSDMSTSMHVISGVVLSGNEYVSNAFVCLDLNSDKNCSKNEPNVIASDRGEFYFFIEKDAYETALNVGYVLAMQYIGGQGNLTALPYLVGFVNADKVVVSPITTLIFNQSIKDNVSVFKKINIENSKRIMIEQLGLKSVSVDDLLTDYIETQQSELTELAERIKMDLVNLGQIESNSIHENYSDF